MREAGRMIDGLDMHHYTLAGTWASKGPATGFNETQWFRAMRNALAVDEMITRHAAIMDKYDPRKRVALIVGEWGMWHDPEPGSHPGFLYQQNSMRDAVVAAASFDIFNKHADRVRGANIAQMVNVLQAMILTQGSQVLLTPTYHVFEFYTVHHDAVLLPITVSSAGVVQGGRRLGAGGERVGIARQERYDARDDEQSRSDGAAHGDGRRAGREGERRDWSHSHRRDDGRVQQLRASRRREARAVHRRTRRERAAHGHTPRAFRHRPRAQVTP